MSASREDLELLLLLDQVHRPSMEKRQFAYSDELARVARTGTFFQQYGPMSDERFWVRDIANYFEMLGTIWRQEIVDTELVFRWGEASTYWTLVGPILKQAREEFDASHMWRNFEALAFAQARAGL